MLPIALLWYRFILVTFSVLVLLLKLRRSCHLLLERSNVTILIGNWYMGLIHDLFV